MKTKTTARYTRGYTKFVRDYANGSVDVIMLNDRTNRVQIHQIANDDDDTVTSSAYDWQTRRDALCFLSGYLS